MTHLCVTSRRVPGYIIFQGSREDLIDPRPSSVSYGIRIRYTVPSCSFTLGGTRLTTRANKYAVGSQSTSQSTVLEKAEESLRPRPCLLISGYLGILENLVIWEPMEHGASTS